jgi:hypothetical protein
MIKKNHFYVGKGICIPFKIHNRLRSVSAEKEEQVMMKKNNIVKGEGLKRLQPLKFNY